MKEEVFLSTLDLINLIASLSGIILAVLAFVLSILFYKWSEKSNKEIVTVAQAIDNNTKKIENLFDRLYNDTFGIMKSNVEAMQNQLYKSYSFSSGDSALNDIELLESTIISIVTKSKIVTKDSITVYIQSLHSKSNFSEVTITNVVEKLAKNGKIYIKDNLISIGSIESKSSESESPL